MINNDHLRQIPLFSTLSEEELTMCLGYGEELLLKAGEEFITEGKIADYFYILLTGKVQVTKNISNNNAINVASHGAGTFLGEVPLLLGIPYEVSIRTIEKSHIFCLKKENFWQMLSTCNSLTHIILKTMAERVSLVQSVSQEHAKLISLGRLAAGLAHELNNPAAAANHTAIELHEVFQILPLLSFKLGLEMQREETSLTKMIPDILKNIFERSKSTLLLSSNSILQNIDREEEIISWFNTHGITDGWKLAPTFVGFGYDIKWLDNIVEHVSHNNLNEYFKFIDSVIRGLQFLHELEHATIRISELVKSIKIYSYMDQGSLQDIDIHEGLESTITILNHKIKKEGIEIIREYESDLPHIIAYGSELNQVWTNLISNAIDSINGKGQIWLKTNRSNDRIIVEIADDGPGIPPEIQPRIFEPFFTTKDVGKGTGLGLSISYRIITEMHKGDITFTSKPGDTRFKVSLPVK